MDEISVNKTKQRVSPGGNRGRREGGSIDRLSGLPGRPKTRRRPRSPPDPWISGPRTAPARPSPPAPGVPKPSHSAPAPARAREDVRLVTPDPAPAHGRNRKWVGGTTYEPSDWWKEPSQRDSLTWGPEEEVVAADAAAAMQVRIWLGLSMYPLSFGSAAESRLTEHEGGVEAESRGQSPRLTLKGTWGGGARPPGEERRGWHGLGARLTRDKLRLSRERKQHWFARLWERTRLSFGEAALHSKEDGSGTCRVGWLLDGRSWMPK